MRPVAAVFRVRNLRLMEIARATALLATSGSTIAFVVFAYRLGGPGGVAALAVVRLVVTAVTAPFGAILGDRYDRVRVIVAADSARVLNLLGAAAASAWTSSLTLQLALAALTTAIGMVSAPARGALLPALAETPDTLTAANVVAGATDTVASLVGPALAGVALAAFSPTVAFLAAGVVAALSPIVVRRIRSASAEPATEHDKQSSLTRAAFAGFGAVLSAGPARALLVLYAVVSLAGGALTVLFTVAAIRLLGLGESGVGFLYSFFSGGAVVGSLVSVVLIGRALESGIVVGVIAGGIPLIVVGLWPNAAVACALFALAGAGDTVASVASVTLLQRVIPRAVLSRSFGALGFVLTAISVVGSVLAPIAVHAFGVRGALVLFGAIVPIGGLPAGVALRASARAAPAALRLLRDVPIFAPLPPGTLEQLANMAEEVHVAPQSVLFRAGDEGDRFYVVRDGEVELSSDGRVLAREPRGGSFGEIALLRDVPRTATATAPAGASLYAIRREDFLAALAGHTPALEAAEALVTARLAGTA